MPSTRDRGLAVSVLGPDDRRRHRRATDPTGVRPIEGPEPGIGVFDTALGLVFFNRPFVDLLALPADPVPGATTIEDLIRIGRERGESAAGEIRSLLDRCAGRVGAAGGCRLHHLRRGGTVVDLECRRLNGGGFVVTARDLDRDPRPPRRSGGAVPGLAEGFMLWDADDRLVTCSDSIREAYPGLEDILVPGRRFEDNLRESLARGAIDLPPTVDPQAWIDERVERHRHPGRPIERRTGAGHWLRIVEQRTSAGGIVGMVVDVTDLKDAGEALRRSERRFKDFASASSDWFWEMGPDLRFTWFSEQMERITGMSPRRLIGMTRIELGEPDLSDAKWVRHLAELEARRPFRDFRYPLRDDRGAEVQISVSGIPVFDDDGGFLGYRGTGTNVTAEVLAERKVAEAQERLRDAIESISDGFALYDGADRLVLFNDNYRRALAAVADLLAPGARFEDLFRALVERGEIAAPRGSEEAWIRDRLAERERPGAVRAYETGGGRWIEVHEYPTRDGGRVIIRTDATDRKQAEHDLRRSRESLANAQRIAHLGNWDLNVISNEFWWSDEIYRIFGLDPQALPATYDLLLDIVHPQDRQRVQRAVDAALYRNTAYGIEHRIVRPDGCERIVRQDGEVVFDAFGTPRRMTGTVQDITERRLAERALQEVEQRFRLAFETSPDAMSISRLSDGRVVDVNDGYTAMTACARDEALGRTGVEIGYWLSPEDRDRLLDRVRREGQVRNLECRFRRRDGEIRAALMSASLMMWNGEPHVLAVAKDISELKNAERALRKFERAVEQGPAAVIVTDTEGAIEYVNPKFTEMTGYPRDDVIGRNPRILRSGSMSHDDYAALWSTIKQGREWRGELCNRRKDGSLYWASASISPIKGRDGRVTHFIGIQENITDRKLALERLQASEERFRCLVESAVLGIVIDRDGKPLFANRTFAVVFGYESPEEILALGSLDPLYSADHLDRIRSYRRERLRGASAPDEYEFEGIRKDGSLIWIRTQVNLITWNGETAVQSTVVDITLRKIYEQRLHFQANFDAVTELPNRTLALDRLSSVVASAKRHSRKVGVLFIDVDHFKKINDTLGHALGDRFLREAGRRIRACVREEDTVARLGGDEFTVILPDLKSGGDAEGVARKILDAFGRPFSLDGHEAFVSASIGITVCPDDGGDPEALMRNADAAMYQAKESGRNTLRFFTRELNARAIERNRMESALRRGLTRNEFTLHYQPLVDIRSGDIVGAESLLRWHSPDLGIVSPDRFVRLAEDTGQIVAIGDWVLRTACRQARIWQKDAGRRFRLSVNVSSRQFRGAALVESVTDALRDGCLPADCLELEITERLLMNDLPETMAAIGSLDTAGVRLAIDDFGTGYSSLSYLSRFPIDTLKIDRSFTHGMLSDRAHATLVEAIIAMAHHLNLRVVAEGVETREQLAFLAARGCDIAQGYHFSPPLACEAFGELLAGWRPERAAHRG
ncbi:MAG: PAS domain S-box protein [Rhodospirillales bacterium]